MDSITTYLLMVASSRMARRSPAVGTELELAASVETSMARVPTSLAGFAGERYAHQAVAGRTGEQTKHDA